jgi:hypothetical protein
MRWTGGCKPLTAAKAHPKNTVIPPQARMTVLFGQSIAATPDQRLRAAKQLFNASHRA